MPTRCRSIASWCFHSIVCLALLALVTLHWGGYLFAEYNTTPRMGSNGMSQTRFAMANARNLLCLEVTNIEFNKDYRPVNNLPPAWTRFEPGLTWNRDSPQCGTDGWLGSTFLNRLGFDCCDEQFALASRSGRSLTLTVPHWFLAAMLSLPLSLKMVWLVRRIVERRESRFTVQGSRVSSV